MQENHTHLKEKLQQGLNDLNIFDPSKTELLWRYLLLLQKWNQVYNLTAVRDLEEMISQHILDSLAIYPYLKGTTFIDVGTGAGLPGIPLSIILSEKNFTLLDSNSKKTAFLLEVKNNLALTHTNIICARVEDHHATYDGILSRAFSSLSDFVNSTQHLVKKEGAWYAMKGPQYQEELTALPNINIEIKPLTIPFLAKTRFLIIIKNEAL